MKQEELHHLKMEIVNYSRRYRNRQSPDMSPITSTGM